MYGIFARNLIRIRQESGLKMYAAADALGVSKSTWSQWESGKRFPNGEMLAAIADCLAIQPDVLLKPIEDNVDEIKMFTKREPCVLAVISGNT